MLPWTTKANNIIQIRDMDNVYLATILRTLKHVAVIKKETLATVYENMANTQGGIVEAYLLQMYDLVKAKDWKEFADDIIFDLIYEAAKRGLVWDIHNIENTIGPISIDGPNRGSLERSLVGALRDSINKHGAITRETAPSAAKRIIGTIKDHNRKLTCRKQTCPN